MAISFPYIYKEKSSPLEIVSWADGTPAQLAAMLQAHDAGKINIYDYWSVEDERTEHMSAIPANPNGAFTTAMDAQDVVMVLMNEGYQNQQGIHFAVGQKECLLKGGRINATSSYAGSWKNCLMRGDLNTLYYNAFRPDFRALFKKFNVLTAKTYNGSVNETVQDYFTLFAEKEVTGTQKKSNTTEANALSQIEYYEIASHRQKNTKDVGSNWWFRSMAKEASGSCCCMSSSWGASQLHTDYEFGVAPFGCI